MPPSLNVGLPAVTFSRIPVFRMPRFLRFALSLPSSHPACTSQLLWPGVWHALRRIITEETTKGCEVIVVFEHLHSAVMVTRIRSAFPQVRVACRSYDVLSMAFEPVASAGKRLAGLAWERELRRIRAPEQGMARACDRFWCICDADACDYWSRLGIEVDGVFGVSTDSDRYAGVAAGAENRVLHIGGADIRKTHGIRLFLSQVWRGLGLFWRECSDRGAAPSMQTVAAAAVPVFFGLLLTSDRFMRITYEAILAGTLLCALLRGRGSVTVGRRPALSRPSGVALRRPANEATAPSSCRRATRSGGLCRPDTAGNGIRRRVSYRRRDLAASAGGRREGNEGEAPGVQRSHILMLAPILPWPADTGGLVRMTALYRGLRRHYDVSFIAGFPSGATPAALDEGVEVVNGRLPGFGLRLVRMLLSRRPYHEALYACRRTRARAAALLRRRPADLVFCHFIYSVQYLPRAAGAPVCVDQQNVDEEYWRSKAAASSGVRRLVMRLNGARVRAFERRLLPRLGAYVCVSGEDVAATRAYAAPRPVLLAPNGVDPVVPRPRAPRPAGEPLTLGFLGSLDIGMNVATAVHLYRDLWPRIRAGLPGENLRLLLIGRRPAPILRQLADGDPSVAFSGTVDSVRPWLERLDLLVAPLVEGAGTKLKILEAMALGLPVVGSPIAFLGLGGRSGLHYQCSADDDAFVADVCRLARAPEERAALGDAGCRFVHEHFGWPVITDRLAADLARCFGLRAAGPAALPPKSGLT
jgi:glycosyltransferase involved in cell wall biosynthesis